MATHPAVKAAFDFNLLPYGAMQVFQCLLVNPAGQPNPCDSLDLLIERGFVIAEIDKALPQPAAKYHVNRWAAEAYYEYMKPAVPQKDSRS
jgi:hypothetical protein